MDKIKESIGLERQRNLIIKRYDKELLRSVFIIPPGKKAVSIATTIG